MGGRLLRALARRVRRVTRGRVREHLPAEVDGECVFCRIVDGRGDASVVASSDRAVV